MKNNSAFCAVLQEYPAVASPKNNFTSKRHQPWSNLYILVIKLKTHLNHFRERERLYICSVYLALEISR